MNAKTPATTAAAPAPARTEVSIPLRLPYPRGAAAQGVDHAAWKVLTESIWPAAKTVEAVFMAIAYCKARGLDPMKRPIHIVPVWSAVQGKMVETVWPGISELRTTASRTGQYAGKDATVFGPDKTDTFHKNATDRKPEVTLDVTYPEWAQITVHRLVGGNRYAFVGPTVYWKEAYASEGRDTDMPNEMWRERARGQLEKCFSPDTEVLTDRGFEHFDSVTGRVLQVGSAGLEPTVARPFVQPYTGPMVRADGDALNFMVTPNHDMVIDGGLKIEAGEMFAQATSAEKFRIPAKVDTRSVDADIPDRALQLAAAFVCDGYRRPYGKFSIAVSRPYKIEWVESVGGHTGRYTARTAGDVSVMAEREIITRSDKEVFTFRAEEVLGLVDMDKCFDPAVLLGLSQRQARLLVDTMVLFDGAEASSGTQRFCSSRPAVIAAFELAAVIAGYAVSRRRERISDGSKPNIYVTISEKESLPVLRYSASQITRGDKGGIIMTERNPAAEVWCVTVPSGLIVVRRNGLSMICGNCAEAAALRLAFPEEIGNELTAEEMHGKVVDGHYDGTAFGGTGGETLTPPRPKESEFARPTAQPDTGPSAPVTAKDTAPATTARASKAVAGDPRPEAPPPAEGLYDGPEEAGEPEQIEAQEPPEASSKGFAAAEEMLGKLAAGVTEAEDLDELKRTGRVNIDHLAGLSDDERDILRGRWSTVIITEQQRRSKTKGKGK